MIWTSRPVLVGREDALSAPSASSEARGDPWKRTFRSTEANDDVPPCKPPKLLHGTIINHQPDLRRPWGEEVLH